MLNTLSFLVARLAAASLLSGSILGFAGLLESPLAGDWRVFFITSVVCFLTLLTVRTERDGRREDEPIEPRL